MRTIASDFCLSRDAPSKPPGRDRAAWVRRTGELPPDFDALCLRRPTFPIRSSARGGACCSSAEGPAQPSHDTGFGVCARRSHRPRSRNARAAGPRLAALSSASALRRRPHSRAGRPTYPAAQLRLAPAAVASAIARRGAPPAAPEAHGAAQPNLRAPPPPSVTPGPPHPRGPAPPHAAEGATCRIRSRPGPPRPPTAARRARRTRPRR
jgi:hypothetical protein